MCPVHQLCSDSQQNCSKGPHMSNEPCTPSPTWASPLPPTQHEEATQTQRERRALPVALSFCGERPSQTTVTHKPPKFKKVTMDILEDAETNFLCFPSGTTHFLLLTLLQGQRRGHMIRWWGRSAQGAQWSHPGWRPEHPASHTVGLTGSFCPWGGLKSCFGKFRVISVYPTIYRTVLFALVQAIGLTSQRKTLILPFITENSVLTPQGEEEYVWHTQRWGQASSGHSTTLTLRL